MGGGAPPQRPPPTWFRVICFFIAPRIHQPTSPSLGSRSRRGTGLDRPLPSDVIQLPPLIPALVEDYLVAYLATIPGAGHVQILGVPRLERAEVAVQRGEPRRFSWLRRDWPIFPWRRRRQPRQAINLPRSRCSARRRRVSTLPPRTSSSGALICSAPMR